MKKTIYAICASMGATLAVGTLAVGQDFAPQATPPAGQQGLSANGQAGGSQEAPIDAIAKVNGDVITKQEYEVRLKPHLEANPGIDQQTKQVLSEQVMDGLIKERLVDQYLAEKIEKPAEEEVEAVVGQVKQQAESQGSSFEQFLESQGQTEDGMKKRIEGAISWQKFLQNQVSEQKLQQFFSENQNYFAGKQYDEARPEVMQAYSMNLWQQVAEQARPEAEIEVMQSPEEAGAQIEVAPQPQPQGGQQGAQPGAPLQ